MLALFGDEIYSTGVLHTLKSAIKSTILAQGMARNWKSEQQTLQEPGAELHPLHPTSAFWLNKSTRFKSSTTHHE